MADSTSSGSAPDSGGESADGSPEALARQARDEARRRPPDRWRAVATGPETSVKWHEWLSADRHIDPYLVWADVTRFAGFQRQLDGGGGKLAFAIEFRHRLRALTPQTCQNPSDRDDPDLLLCELDIPGIYFQLGSASDKTRQLTSRFVTARAPVQTVARLLTSPSVRRMQLGLPRIGDVDPRRPDLGLAAGRKNRVIVGVIDDGVPFAHPSLCDRHGATRLRFLWDQEASRPVDVDGWLAPRRVGYGAELQHPELKAASQAARAGNSQALAYAQVNYGPVQLGLDLFGTMFQQPVGAANGAIRDLPVGSMRSKTHGAGVMFLAAGTMADEPTARSPIAETLTPLQWQRALPSAARAYDYADKWPLVFVQLPTRTILDTSGGSLAVHVLDGIRYIIDRAECIADVPAGREPDGAVDADAPGPDRSLPRDFTNHTVIINISYGSTAGPHDGTSIVEQAIADLVAHADPPEADSGSRDSTWVCLAAGNSHGSLTHAVLALKAGATKTFIWTVGPDNPLQTFLEIWIPDADLMGHAITRQRQDGIAIVLRPPAGSAMRPVRVTSGQARAWQDSDPAMPPTAGVIFARKVAQGLRGTMVLVAVAPTRKDPNFGTAAPHGRWYVDVTDHSLESESGSEIAVHAWAERNDLVYGNRRSQQSTVFGDDPVPEVTEFTPPTADYLRTLGKGRPAVQMTDQLQGSPELASLAGASTPLDSPFFRQDDKARGRVVVAGAHRIADGEVSRYSSGGPSRHQGQRSLNVPLPNFSLQPPGVTPVFSAARNRPDATAPADLSPALQGLRVASMQAGQWTRLSGTSAAAPSVARAIANAQYEFTYGKTPADCVDSGCLAARYGVRRTPAAGDASPRPTPTPAKDDLFRRADWIVE